MSNVKNISRRTFLKGAGAVAASSLLPNFPNIVRADNHEINIIGWGSDWFDELFEGATEATGVKINRESLPARWSDVMQKFTLWGQTGYSHIDIMMTDDLLAGMYGMNGWAIDLSDLKAYNDNVDDITDSVKVLDGAMGGVYRLFYFMGATPFFRNADLVADAPATWDDFVSAGLGATDQEAGVWGWRPLGGQGHAFNTMLMALHHSGADLETLNDDATRAALQWMYDWVNEYEITPPSTINEGWNEVIGLMAGGKAGMCWGYEGMYNSVTTTVDTVVTEDNFKLSRFPMGPANDNLLLHGWGYSIPSASTKIEQARDVLEYLGHRDQLRFVALQNVVPGLKSFFTDEEILAKIPVLGVEPGWEELTRGAQFRYPIVNNRQVSQLWSMFDQLGEFILSGERDVDDAFQWAQDELTIIKFAY
ncbi:MAG: substrate-binding domain-containing protein [Chloroflexi bacterium]|nr:substrate-binding domain-containing protein [Chloroflexota bacterium]